MLQTPESDNKNVVGAAMGSSSTDSLSTRTEMSSSRASTAEPETKTKMFTSKLH